MNIKTLAILQKNQKGQFIKGGFFYFECPICKKTRLLVTACHATKTALVEIEKNPLVQMICTICNFEIKLLNESFDKLKFFKKWRLKKFYKKLGW